MININEALLRIKQAGATNVRAVPADGQNIHTGLYQIEIREAGNWIAIATGMPRSTAEDLIRQATNKVILG